MDRLKTLAGTLLFGAAALIGCSSGSPENPLTTVEQPLVSPNGAITASADESRGGWYPNQPSLNPSIVGGPTFGRLFKTALPLSSGEQVFAQPLVIDNDVFVVTEANNAYVLDTETGAIKASRSLHQPWLATDSSCGDITPTVGVTGTPVIDASTRTAYFFAKTYRAVRTGVLENDTVWYAHAVDVDTLAERPNFPVEISGHATNDSTVTFTPNLELQRPGLLLMNGVVYAAFGAHCDVGNYNGFVVGVTTSGHVNVLFAAEAGPQKDHGAGIWQSGAGLMSDGPGRIFFMTGNGFSNALVNPIPSNLPPATLDESAARVDVQPDGTLKAMDFFTPYDVKFLDQADSDFGAGGPVALPAALATTQHPHLMLAGGKEGVLYLLDRDAMGGFKQGTGQGDAVVSRVNTFAGMWSHPAVWAGEGGWAYVTASSSALQALHFSLQGDGTPVFASVGSTADTFGFGSGSPIITSDGTTAGSGLVWITYASGGYGSGALRAYDAVPDSSGTLVPRYEDAYGRSAKFSMPGVGAGRVYVGTSDGYVVGYGSPTTEPLSGNPVDFGTVVVGSSASQSVVLTATTATTVTGLSTSNPAFALGTPSLPLPAALAAGQTLTVPVTFTPAGPQSYVGSLDMTGPQGPSALGMKGVGQASGPSLQVNPSALSFGGVAIGSTTTTSLVLSNVGNAPLTFTAITPPAAPFSVAGAPTVGQVLGGNSSITVTVTYSPVASGTFVDHFNVSGGGKALSVYLSGTSAYQGALSIQPMSLDYGVIGVGKKLSMSFALSNSGGTSVTINKSKPPSLGVFGATTSVDEGSVLPGGAALGEAVQFAPTAPGAFTDHWIFGSSDGSGEQVVTFTGFASSGVGLLGSYYNGTGLSGTALKHLDPQITFNWGASAPLAGIDPSGYSVHWEGEVQAIHDETYTFYTKSDQGVRLSVAQSLIINNWTDHSLTENFGQIALQAGQKYAIVLEYYSHDQHSAVELDWSSPSTPRQAIPAVALFPAQDPSAGSCQFLALSRVAATSSSNESADLGPANAIDGDPNTRWSSQFSDPQWLSVDLGTMQRVRRVVLTWQGAASKDYDVQIANAAAGPWTTVYTNSHGVGGVDDIQILDVNARYVRMYSRSRTTQYGDSLYEFEVYGDPSTSCGPGPSCGNGVVDPGEQCDDGNTVNTDACSNSCLIASCTDGIKNEGETGIDCGGPCGVCSTATCTDGIKNEGETGIDCGGPCVACVTATCSDGLQNQGETGIDCGGPCAACVTATCTDGIQNQGETGIDCGGPCAACSASSCQSVALPRVSATASSLEQAAYPASNAIDNSTTTRWSSQFSDPQWIYVDMGAVARVRRVVLNWEGAASSSYDVQVATNAAGPWTTIFTQPNGDGGVDDIGSLNANGRYVRMYSRTRLTPYGDSLFDFAVYGDTNSTCGTAPTCSDGVQNQGETGIDCGGPCAACVTATCSDGIKNQNETGVDCGGVCPAYPSCTDGVKNQGETGVDCGGPCAACPTCSDGIKNQGETGVDCGGVCPACPSCTDGIKNQGETGVDCGGPCAACPTCSDGIENQGETGVDCGGPCAACAVATCSDGIQNQGETSVDCGGPCAACMSTVCQSVALPRSSATASSAQSTAYAASSAIDASATTRWSSQFSDPQWIYVDMGALEHVSRVVLTWEGAASSNFDIQVATNSAGPWTTIYTQPNGTGGTSDIGALNATGRYVRMYSRARLTAYGNSLFDFKIYGDTNTTCGGGATCSDGVQDQGETGVDCGGPCTACIAATCTDGIKNQNETGIDCGGACPACATCSDGIKNQNETGVDCGGVCPACVTATCTDGIKNQNETGIDCGGACPACATCSDGIKNQNETGIDCGGVCPACITATCSDGIQNQGETGLDCGGPCPACTTTACQSVALPRVSATASSIEQSAYPASYAIDASTTTRWASQYSDPQWIYVDMGAVERVRRVVLMWEAAASSNFDIQVATSAAGPWTTIYTQTSGTGGTNDIGSLNTNGRYVRMYSRARLTTYGNSLFDFKIYGDSNLTCGG